MCCVKLIIICLLCWVESPFAFDTFNILEYANITSLPRYKRENGCILPQHPKKGQWSVYKSTTQFFPGDSVPSGGILQVSCQETYKLDGDAAIVCLNDKWTAEIGQCSKICPSIYSTPNMKVTCIYNNQKSENCTEAVDGTFATFECSNFYEDTGLDLHPVYICFNGKWSHNIPECVPKCGQKATKGNPTLIVNASVAAKGDYPWQVALYNITDKNLLCGGSLLNQRVVLTAAHCVTSDTGKLIPKETYLIAVGKYFRKFDHPGDHHLAKFSEIYEIFVPKKYKGHIQNFFGDVAIIVTKKIFVMSERVQPVCIDWGFKYQRMLLDETRTHHGYVSGWGYTVEYKNPSEVLKELKVPIISNDQCDSDLPEDYQKFMTDDKLCAGFLNQGTSVCRGDSGGALVTKFKDRFYAIGIVSLSPQAPTAEGGCDSQQYTLFTNIYYYINELILEKEARYRPTVLETEEDGSHSPENTQATTTISTTTSTTTTEKTVTEATTISGCALPEHPFAGQWSIFGTKAKLSPGHVVSPATVLRIECNQKYRLDGEAIVVCQKGKWSPEIGKCLPTCPPIKNTDTTLITCTFKDNETDCNTPIDGTVAKHTCLPYYENLELSKNPVRVCRNGTWDSRAPECVPICGQKSASVQTLIINGNNAKKGDYPWHVAIYRNKKFICSGTLISENVVLTAAHCITYSYNSSIVKEKNIVVGAGKYYREYYDPVDYKAQYSELESVFIPEQYKEIYSNFAGDIAILITKRRFTLSKNVQPVCVDWKNSIDLKTNLTGYITGWGYKAATTLSDELQDLKVPLVSYQKCFNEMPEEFKSFLTFDKLCAGYLNMNTSACSGDTGGPLIVKHSGRYYITGIISTSPSKEGRCDSNQYTFYTSVAKYHQFIEKHLIQSKPLEDHNIGCQDPDSDTCPTTTTPKTTEAPKYGCMLPEHPSFGKWSLFISDSYTLSPGMWVGSGTVLSVTCRDKYKLDGNSVILCDQGKWSSTIGRCLRTCASVYSNHVLKATCIFNGKESENCTNPIEGTQVKYQCAPYYEDGALTQYPVHTCKDGLWDHITPNCVAVCGIKSVKPQPLIIGGTTVEKGDYPWAVAIYREPKKEFICGGTIISSRLILTAAQCVTNHKGELEPNHTFTVSAGRYYQSFTDPREDNSTVQSSSLEAIFVPDFYQGEVLKYLADIAVLVTPKPFTFTQTVQPACVDWTSQYAKRTNLTGSVTGWGFTTENASPSPVIKELEVPLVSDEMCRSALPTEFVPYLTRDKFCAGHLNKGNSVCAGDSGGGLVVKAFNRYYVTGIVSLAPRGQNGGCNSQQFALYTKVAAYIDFIQDKKNRYKD